jgi:hypothetical protein
MASSLRTTQEEIRSALVCFPILALQAETDSQRIDRVKCAIALDACDTEITEGILKSNSDAINALAHRLNQSSANLSKIHHRVVELASRLNEIKSAADALGNLLKKMKGSI